jgi:hypothetical protein
MQRAIAGTGIVYAAIVNQAVLLQMLKGIRYRISPSIVIQYFLAEAGRVSMEQTGEHFFLQCIVDGHIYSALLVDERCL